MEAVDSPGESICCVEAGDLSDLIIVGTALSFSVPTGPSNSIRWRNGDRETYPSFARLPIRFFADGDPSPVDADADEATPFEVRRSSVSDTFRGVDPALIVFLDPPDTFRPPLAVDPETLRALLPELFLPVTPPTGRPSGGLCAMVGDDLKIELLTRLLPRTCLKLELVRLGPDEMTVEGCGGGCGEPNIDPRFEVFKGAHPLVELLMMLARSLSSKRRDVEGDAEGERTLSMGR